MKYYVSDTVVKIIERTIPIQAGELFTEKEVRKLRLERLNLRTENLSSHDCVKKNGIRVKNILL